MGPQCWVCCVQLRIPGRKCQHPWLHASSILPSWTWGGGIPKQGREEEVRYLDKNEGSECPWNWFGHLHSFHQKPAQSLAAKLILEWRSRWQICRDHMANSLWLWANHFPLIWELTLLSPGTSRAFPVALSQSKGEAREREMSTSKRARPPSPNKSASQLPHRPLLGQQLPWCVDPEGVLL